MMELQTDEQTIEDLGIFGRRNARGIYDLYNGTRTRGGEELLRELFRRPLSDAGDIRRRSSLISLFASQCVSFPFRVSTLDSVEKYLREGGDDNAAGRHKNVLGEKEIQNGVTGIIELIQAAKAFIDSAPMKAAAAFSEQIKAALQLLQDPVFEPVVREQVKNRLSFAAVTAYDVLFRLREHAKIKKFLSFVYYLDVYLSVADLATARKFIFPKVLEKQNSLVSFEGICHPELKNAVGNDVKMDISRNVIFLTGANMAGKSTFLRAVSIAVYIAHIGFPVAAAAMEFSVMDGIYTTINLPDNLGIGASHFYNEVLRVKKIATELRQNKSLFVVFDELFRGTNVKDAHEATVAVTDGFSNNKNSLFIISSHIVEAGEALKQKGGIGFFYLPTKMNGHVPEYTYKLEAGISDDRHGMVIIRNEGILDVLKNGKK